MNVLPVVKIGLWTVGKSGHSENVFDYSVQRFPYLKKVENK